ncbi:MAG: hypothetical protein WC792_00230 [Candidatus Micrarchaeia archaeon]|jgi:hypothetical protein
MAARESMVLSHARRLAEPMNGKRAPTPEDLGHVFASSYYFGSRQSRQGGWGAEVH